VEARTISRWVTPNNLSVSLKVSRWSTGTGSLLLGVKDTGLLEGLGEYWDGRVDGVGDD
jgi:hypothetical protein